MDGQAQSNMPLPLSKVGGIMSKKMTDNTNLDLVNIIAHTKFGHILLISSKDVEPKRNSDISKGQ